MKMEINTKEKGKERNDQVIERCDEKRRTRIQTQEYRNRANIGKTQQYMYHVKQLV